MCFRFGSCFGSGSQDYGRSTRKQARCHGGRRRGSQADHGYYGGPSRKAAPQAYHSMPAAGDEDGHNTGAVHAGGHGYYGGTGNKVGSEMPIKLPASRSRIIDYHAGYSNSTPRLQEAAAAVRGENGARDYLHQYPTATTTTLERN